MSAPLTILFRDVRATRALDADIRERFEKLERYCKTMIDGRVTVGRAAQRHRSGNRYQVHITLTLPGETIVIDHGPNGKPAATAGDAKIHKRDEPQSGHTLAGVAIREAFEQAKRRLQDHVRRARDRHSVHAGRPKARA